MQIRWLKRAVGNVEAIARYIEDQDRPLAAAGVVARIEKAVARLEDNPLLGRQLEDSDARELVVGGTPYIILYRVRNNEVVVRRVIHGARKRPTR